MGRTCTVRERAVASPTGLFVNGPRLASNTPVHQYDDEASRFFHQHGELSLVNSPTFFHELIETQRRSLLHFLEKKKPLTAVYPVIIPVTLGRFNPPRNLPVREC